MADVKWIKILTDVFDDEKILLIESLPDADSLIVIWFKLLCLAGKQNNSGVFLINSNMPYTDEMFSTIFRRPLNTVRLAMNTFEQFGMVEILNGAVTIPNWGKHQNIEGMEARKDYMKDYMKEYREKQKQITSVNANVNANVNINEAKCKLPRIDKIREDKKRIDKIRIGKPSIEEIQSYITETGSCVDAMKFYDYYESNGWKVGKNPMKDWKATIRNWSRKDQTDKPKGNSFLDLEFK